MATIARRAYAEMFGPTTGDRLRLADTELIIEVEADHTLRSMRGLGGAQKAALAETGRISSGVVGSLERIRSWA